MGPGPMIWKHTGFLAYEVSSVCVFFRHRNVPATFLCRVFVQIYNRNTFLEDAQRPYDQNGGSIAPRSFISDLIAKEAVYKNGNFRG